MNDASQATAEELREARRKCWAIECKRTAWMTSWKSWNWCFCHAWYHVRWGGGPFWFELTHLRFRYPFRKVGA